MTLVRPGLKRSLAAALVAGLFCVSALSSAPALADDGPPSGFPTWQDVQAAKGNQAAKSAEVTKINGLLAGLSTESDRLGTVAVQAGATYATTKQLLDAATAQVGVLQAQASRAEGQAGKYKKEAGAIAAQSYKTGGANLGLFATLNALQTPNSLQNLDVLHMVGAKAGDLYTQASASQSVAESLTAAQQAAEAERATLAAEAKSSLDAAVAAQNAVTAQLAQKKEQSGVLVAQLASLNNTTAAVEQKYQQGQAALAAYQAAQEAKRQAAAAEAARQQAAAAAAQQAQAQQPAPGYIQPAAPDTSNGYVPVDVLLPNIPGGAVNDPGGAQAYASSRLGAYGWGQDQFQCLIQLWNQESSWLTNATNPTSGAYGIAQALPPGKYSDAGGDWLTNYRTQIEWGFGYIKDRYGSPCGAWAHETSMNWY
jgi:peptidoglycan DL-endopeptidase CwlO